MMNGFQNLLLTTVAAILVTGCSLAPKHYPDGKGSYSIGKFNNYTYAHVVDIRYISTPYKSDDKQTCYNIEREQMKNRLSSTSRTTSVLAGATAGGVVGNQFGKGGGKKAMTAVGAAAGATIADIFSNPDYLEDEGIFLGTDCVDPGTLIKGDYYKVTIASKGQTFTYRTSTPPTKGYVNFVFTVWK